ncbi:hypothetical protein G7Y89_g6151 [Cudoniella acicularis]|uniref:Heterokaryon incompatibility domain-containing protein n=1 Tax=Cudoniella acicularis TaxID=354080 RepID=A0A8H4RN96_9HELO|nr:hypothetical protein G7Y89_g6151 [Cudoniella acicularis]
MSSVYYENLDRDRRAIRILKLLPGSWPTRIHCQLKRVLLTDTVVYEAVSYAWGDPNNTKTVLVEGIEMQVPCNLETCLQHLRKPNEALQLWVDALCINQQDLREKECQIGMMGEIFRRCTSAYIWLGVPTTIESSSKFHLELKEISKETIKHQIDPFTIIYHFAGNQHLHELSCFRSEPSKEHFLFCEDRTFKRIWESFKDALQKPWWSRFWCVQECLLPSSAVVVLGQWRVPWKTLKICQMNYERHITSCCAELSGLMPVEYIFYPDMTVVKAQLDSSHMSCIFSDISSNLDLLLRSFRYKACQDPRDKVYGILGLIDRSKYFDLVIDYSLSTTVVYINAMSAMLLDGSGDLRCLTGLGFNSHEYDLPSWVRNFGACPDLGSVSHELTRYQSYILYNASNSTNYIPVIRNKTLLCLSGNLIDKIHRVGKSIEHRSWQHIHNVLQNWSVLAEVHIPTDMSSDYFYESKVNAFWRTIVGDMLFESEQLLRRTNTEDLEALRLWIPKMVMSMKTGVEPPLEAWLTTMISFTYGRALFLTEKGHLGLCYPDCRPGDELWALHGGRVPFILMPKHHLREGSMQNDHQYKFMGEGYLHGFMDGEILQDSFSQTEEVTLW